MLTCGATTTENIYCSEIKNDPALNLLISSHGKLDINLKSPIGSLYNNRACNPFGATGNICHMSYVDSVAPDQPAHLRSLT